MDKKRHNVICAKYRAKNRVLICKKAKLYYAKNKLYWINYSKINSERRKQYRENYNFTNKATISKSCHNYYLKNKVNIIERTKNYYFENKNRILEKMKIYNNLNFAIIKVRVKKYQQSFIGRMAYRVVGQNYRARKKNAIGKIDLSVLLFLWGRTKGFCEYCGKFVGDLNFHLDHVIPLSKGGTNLVENLVLACPTCNLSKGNKNLFDWGFKEGKFFVGEHLNTSLGLNIAFGGFY